MQPNKKFKVNDSVKITLHGTSELKNVPGKIVGHSRDGTCCWVIRDGLVTRECFSVAFLTTYKKE